jgi:hypothetical protein
MGTAHLHIVTSRLLKPLKQHFISVTSFSHSKLPYCLPVLFKCTNTFCSDFPNHLDRTINDTEISTRSTFFSLFYIYLTIFTSASSLKTLCVCVCVCVYVCVCV